jgi:PAS domain S-box-containing protein
MGEWLGEIRPWLLIISSIILILLLFLQWANHRYLVRLRRRVLEARGGTLEPVGYLPWLPFLYARKVIQDYDLTINRLRSMFHTVEECQSRVLTERNKINAILQSLPGVLLNVADDLTITTVNRQAEDVFGLTAERMKSINLFDLITLNEHDRAIMRDAFLYKQPIRNQEITLAFEGKKRWFSLNLGFFSEHESDMGAIITLLDISEYRELQDTVANREKLVAMGQLAAGVAHELNTPLGNILGYSQLIEAQPANEAKVSEYARVVSDETKRCSRIVQDLLNYARKEQCSGETCDIGQLLNEVIDTFINCRMRRYGIDVVMLLPREPLVVEGDCGQLDIVFTNLLQNAIHALEGVENPVITIRAIAGDSRSIRIAVEDNGPGVPEEFRSRVFDPFFTTKEVGAGTGLGLSISQAMLAKRGASIRYDGDHTGGARFVVSLPAVNMKRVGNE